VTSSGTLALSFAAGYSLPTDASQTNWNTAFNKRLASASASSTTLTLTLADASTVTTSFPTFNQNTTGTAASLSAVLSKTLGGAGDVNGILKANGSGVVSPVIASDITTLISGTYLPLSGGTLTGALNGTSLSMSGAGSFGGTGSSGTINLKRSSDGAVASLISQTTDNQLDIKSQGGTAILRMEANTINFDVPAGGAGTVYNFGQNRPTSTNVLINGSNNNKLRIQNNETDVIVLNSADGSISGTSAAFSGEGLFGGAVTNGVDKLRVAGSGLFSQSLTAGSKFISTTGNNAIVFESLSATTGYQYMQMLNTTAHTIFGIEGTAAGSLVTNGTAYASVLTTVGNTDLEFGTNQTKRLSIAATTGAITASSSVTASSL